MSQAAMDEAVMDVEAEPEAEATTVVETGRRILEDKVEMHEVKVEMDVDVSNMQGVEGILLTAMRKGACECGPPTSGRATPSWVQSHPFGTVLPRMLQF